jgi:hypothetical protein
MLGRCSWGEQSRIQIQPTHIFWKLTATISPNVIYQLLVLRVMAHKALPFIQLINAGISSNLNILNCGLAMYRSEQYQLWYSYFGPGMLVLQITTDSYKAINCVHRFSLLIEKQGRCRPRNGSN